MIDDKVVIQLTPVYQFQMANGSWFDQGKGSYDYNVKMGQPVVRVLYTAIVQTVQPESTK